MPSTSLKERLAKLDWRAIEQDLDQQGNAIIPALLDQKECAELCGHYPQHERFRSHVLMARHGFGRGEYKYFRYPLPSRVSELREELYQYLVPQANRWNEQMNLPITYPARHADFITRCHAAGQQRPTPLLLQYGPGDYNCLHQDLYGEHVFPLQVAILLSQPGEDFRGGELVLTEQRPRMQSRAQVVPLSRGDAVIFAVNQRPMPSVRGFHRVTLRHGVSVLHSGMRHTLGVIFHDAQ
ncbi:2OG-Fe(II) oxygenase [Pseudomonas yamanorum]